MSRRSTTEARPVSVAVLGTDAVLAVLPASAVQLSHACRALGYDMVFPASWGDELVAQSCLRQLVDHPDEPAILCDCPRVVERLTRGGMELEPWMITLPGPPVAVARYLRSAFGDRPLHITYVGECPAGADPSIDAQVQPVELLAQLGERAIVLADQPQFFESVLPPDRRRHFSLPGGVPTAEQVAVGDPRRALVELDGPDYLLDLAQRLLTKQNALIDVALPAGCACAGATRGARATLIALEPPRAPSPIVDAPSGAASAPIAPVEAAVAHGPADVTGPPAEPRAPDSSTRAPVSAPALVLRARPGGTVPRAFAVQRALAARRLRPVRQVPREPLSTRPRVRPAAQHAGQPARAAAIPLSVEPSFVPPPPPPGKLRANPSLGAAVRSAG